MHVHRKALRQKSRAAGSRLIREENPFHPARRRSHPVSAVKPFILILALMLAAIFAMQQSGVRLSAFSIMLYGIFIMLALFAVAVAYLTHAREYSSRDDDYGGPLELGGKRQAGLKGQRR
ncbi:MAG: hypothetical protein V1708_01580 [Candidatus Micrarchaeota archaeon]